MVLLSKPKWSSALLRESLLFPNPQPSFTLVRRRRSETSRSQKVILDVLRCQDQGRGDRPQKVPLSIAGGLRLRLLLEQVLALVLSQRRVI